MWSAGSRRELSTGRRGSSGTSANIRGWPGRSNRRRFPKGPEPLAGGRQTPMWRTRPSRGPCTNAPCCRAPNARRPRHRPPPPRSPPHSRGASRSGSRLPGNRVIRAGCLHRTWPLPCSLMARSSAPALELWFRTEIGLGGIEVDRHRDVLVDDKPAATLLFIDVGHPHREIELLALLVGAGHALNAVAVGEVAVGGDIEVGQLDGDRAFEVAKKGLPVLPIGSSADILPWRNHVEDDQGLVGCIH